MNDQQPLTTIGRWVGPLWPGQSLTSMRRNSIQQELVCLSQSRLVLQLHHRHDAGRKLVPRMSARVIKRTNNIMRKNYAKVLLFTCQSMLDQPMAGRLLYMKIRPTLTSNENIRHNFSSQRPMLDDWCRLRRHRTNTQRKCDETVVTVISPRLDYQCR